MSSQSHLLSAVAASRLLPSRVRQRLYRALGADLAPGASIGPLCTIRSSDLRLGAGSFLNERVFVDRGPLTVGAGVDVGPGVLLLTRTHETGPAGRRAGRQHDAPITIGDGTWVGAGCVVVGPVVIAPGCVLAAGAVVVASTEPDGLYAGVPARRVRDLA